MKRMTKMRTRILLLVALDESEYAEIVADKASKIASQINADVILLSVVPVPSLVASEGELDKEYLSMKEEEFRRMHANVIDKYFSNIHGVLIESRILHGRPAQKIVEYADAVGADIVMIGTRGYGGFTKRILGSVSSYVLKNCKCQVIVVRGKEN
jgi:nucleotide-binding universal stress UspA family protein